VWQRLAAYRGFVRCEFDLHLQVFNVLFLAQVRNADGAVDGLAAGSLALPLELEDQLIEKDELALSAAARAWARARTAGNQVAAADGATATLADKATNSVHPRGEQA